MSVRQLVPLGILALPPTVSAIESSANASSLVSQLVAIGSMTYVLYVTTKIIRVWRREVKDVLLGVAAVYGNRCHVNDRTADAAEMERLICLKNKLEKRYYSTLLISIALPGIQGTILVYFMPVVQGVNLALFVVLEVISVIMELEWNERGELDIILDSLDQEDGLENTSCGDSLTFDDTDRAVFDDVQRSFSNENHKDRLKKLETALSHHQRLLAHHHETLAYLNTSCHWKEALLQDTVQEQTQVFHVPQKLNMNENEEEAPSRHHSSCDKQNKLLTAEEGGEDNENFLESGIHLDSTMSTFQATRAESPSKDFSNSMLLPILEYPEAEAHQQSSLHGAAIPLKLRSPGKKNSFNVKRAERSTSKVSHDTLIQGPNSPTTVESKLGNVKTKHLFNIPMKSYLPTFKLTTSSSSSNASTAKLVATEDVITPTLVPTEFTMITTQPDHDNKINVKNVLVTVISRGLNRVRLRWFVLFLLKMPLWMLLWPLKLAYILFGTEE